MDEKTGCSRRDPDGGERARPLAVLGPNLTLSLSHSFCILVMFNCLWGLSFLLDVEICTSQKAVPLHHATCWRALNSHISRKAFVFAALLWDLDFPFLLFMVYCNLIVGTAVVFV